MQADKYVEEFTSDECETADKALESFLLFLDRLFVVLGYNVTILIDDDRCAGIRRITATYRKIDP